MPIQRTSASPSVVREAIASASQQTGASFEYLLNTAQRESSMKTNAKSPTSSAAGLFQFVESTWLKMVKDEGPRLGLGEHARMIHKTDGGQYYVANAKERRAILNLRHDAETAALVAGAYTEKNAEYVASRIGREPSEGELYLAHFLGAANAARMIQLVEDHPDRSAASYFPGAAKANASIFYDNGHPRALSDVYQSLISGHIDENEDGSATLKTRYGPLDFGTMGSLIGDIEKSHAPRGHRAHASSDSENGSIGVWGDNGTAATAIEASAGSSDATSVSPAVDTTGTAAADTANAARHSFAANHYRTAAETGAATRSSHDDWALQAFGG
jgi:hypothetical protein